MKKLFAFLTIVCAVAAIAAPVRAGYFPKRPAHRPTYTVSGVLVRWAHGEGLGQIAVRDARGSTHAFYMGYPAKINGKLVRCFDAPVKPVASANPACNDWPSNVVLAHTKVRVVYWNTSLGGHTVQASDEVDSI